MSFQVKNQFAPTAGFVAPGSPFRTARKTDNPLAQVEYTDNAEADTAAEVSAMLTAFKQRSKDETKRFKDATSTEYYCCVCFQSQEQKEAFLAALGFQPKNTYIDGRKTRPGRRDMKMTARDAAMALKKKRKKKKIKGYIFLFLIGGNTSGE